MLQELEWTQESDLYRKQTFYNKQERLTELEHAAVARMDTREWLVKKVNVLHKLDRLVHWFKSGLQNSNMLQKKLEWTQTVACTVQKPNVLHKLDRLVQWFKSDLQNSSMLQ
jgi:hypothetical protein